MIALLIDVLECGIERPAQLLLIGFRIAMFSAIVLQHLQFFEQAFKVGLFIYSVPDIVQLGQYYIAELSRCGFKFSALRFTEGLQLLKDRVYIILYLVKAFLANVALLAVLEHSLPKRFCI